MHKNATPHDFDFLHGRWAVRNRRLMTRLAGASDWIEFPGEVVCEPRLGGIVNVDQIDFPTLGFSGLTVRAFDVGAGRWSIYWVNSRIGTLEPPVHGGFDGDVGEFHGVDTDDGRLVDVRFTWRRMGPRQARWEQAFKPAGAEVPWEMNWSMDFERVGSLPD